MNKIIYGLKLRLLQMIAGGKMVVLNAHVNGFVHGEFGDFVNSCVIDGKSDVVVITNLSDKERV